MEVIKFYKLISPYPEDITMNCKLAMSDIDENFLTFKNYDIKDATYDPETMSISIIRNNGDVINIDLSSLKDFVDEEIEEALSGYTPGGGCDIDLSGELDENGVLTLTWASCSGETSTQISGFLTENDLYHDETLSGNGSIEKPLRLSNLEKTGKYRGVLGIVDSLPTNDLHVGDRYLTKEKFHIFGRMYTKIGMESVKYALENEGSLWRIPTKEDWVKLFEYAEVCESASTEYDDVHEMYEDEIKGEYVGKIAGSVLKSIDFWEGNENYDNLGFSIVPAGYVYRGNLEDAGTKAVFWTDTKTSPTLARYITYSFDGNHDDVLYDDSNLNEWYSIRLVKNINSSDLQSTANILGNEYSIVNIEEIGQSWIRFNLNYNTGNRQSEQYSYDYQNISTDCYIINHWNGYYWERKELQVGDEIAVNEENSVTNYVYVIDENDNGHLVEGESYKLVNDNWRMVIDAGWY